MTTTPTQPTYTNIKEPNLINDTWPVGHRFTISLTVRESGAVGYFLQIMNSDEVFHGCVIEAVGFRDETEKMKDLSARLRCLLSEYAI